MKQKLLLILAVVVATATTAWADDHSGDLGNGLSYSYTEDNHTLTISYNSESNGSGVMADYTLETIGTQPWNGYRTDIQTIVIEDGVTSIGAYAFSGCSNLISPNIGDDVKTIGAYAFNGCIKLSSLTIGIGVKTIGNYAFNGCIELSSLTIGSGVETIGDYAFYGCIELSPVNIPDYVETIGNYAFYGCTGMTTLTIGSDVTTIGEHAFDGCENLSSVTIPNKVKTIGAYAFNGCTGMTTLTIGSDVETIGDYAFYGCIGLPPVNIPNNVETIGAYAFNGCIGMTSVTIGSGVKSIGAYAFEGCTGLSSVIIPDGVENIYASAFSGCPLESVIIPNSVSLIYSKAFGYCSSLTSVTMPGTNYVSYEDNINSDIFTGCTALTTVTLTGKGDDVIDGSNNPLCAGAFHIKASGNYIDLNLIIGEGITKIDGAFCGGTDFYKQIKTVTIGNNVTEIGSEAFRLCTGLTSVTIGSGVETIGDNAFNSCTGLTSVTIGSGVKTIGESAFDGCTGLTSFNIPDNVTTIGKGAFAYCTGLTTVVIGSGVETIDEGVFVGCEYVTDVFLYANPTKLTWNVGEYPDFISAEDDPNYPTKCHVDKDYDVDDFKTKFSNVNVWFVSSTFNIELTANVPAASAPKTSILGNGADEQSYTNTPITVRGIGASKAPDSDKSKTITIGTEKKLPFKITLRDLFGDEVLDGVIFKDIAVTSGTNVTVGDLNTDGLDTEITVLGTGTSVVTLVVEQDTNDEMSIQLTFTVAETIFVLNEAVGITADNVENIKGKVAQFSRSFASGVVSTLCLPFPLTSVTGGTVYGFKDVAYDATANDGAGAWVANFTELPAPTEEKPNLTEARMPYLFRTNANTNDAVVFSGKVANQFDGLAGTSEADRAGGGTWTFHGTFKELTYSSAEAAPAEGPDPVAGGVDSVESSDEEDPDLSGVLTGDVYGFAGADAGGVSAGDFVQAADDAIVPAFRCYLTYDDGEGGTSLSRGDTNSLPSRIIVRLIGLDGQTTAIGTMDTRTGEVRLSDEWYSLDGRKLEGQPTKEGIYINKGKKKRIKN